MKKIWLLLVAAVAVIAAIGLFALPTGSEWTTDSEAALVEFETALDAMKKLYHNDVQAHLEKALELDPDFAMAKLFLADHVRFDDEDRALRLWNDVLASDASKLTPREVFFVNRTRAYQEKRFDDVEVMIDEYLAKYPDDPWVLHQKALRTWALGDLEVAEKLNLRLIEIAPNWVISYNQLGYIAMASGRFVEAEEYFTSYRFVAPDQANPHDSLGELYIILGRYDEAETSLRQSISIKPDFWNAYDHLALVRLLRQDVAGAEAIHAEAVSQPDCPDYWSRGIGCRVELTSLVLGERWREILEMLADDSPCLEGHTSANARVDAHLAACVLGEMEIALNIENKIAETLEAKESMGDKGDGEIFEAILSHLRGVRFAVEGDLEAAVEAFVRTDKQVTYMGAGNGLFKLYNRLLMVEALLATGDEGKAHKVLSKVRSVNPVIAARFEEDGLRILGLERE